jgi:hypothetical protein
MNREDFKKIIGESIESKLRDVLPSILDEYFTSIKKPVPQTISEGPRRNMNESPSLARTAPTEPQQPKKKIQYVKDNSVLNDILNETVVRLKQDGQIVSGGPSTSAAGAPSVLDRISEVPPVVAEALTRDYSQLLKLSKTKSNNR